MEVKNLKKDVTIFLAVLIFSSIFFNVISIFEEEIYHIFRVNNFLTWHVILELMSIVMSFSIFSIAYYTYKSSMRLRTSMFAFTFLTVSIIDLFHTLSYNGMPAFITGSSVNKATYFWIIGRMIMAIGLLFISITPLSKKIKLKPILIICISVTISLFILYLVMYKIDLFPPLYIDDIGLTDLKKNLEYLIITIQFASMLLFMNIYIKGENDEGYNFIILAMVFSIFSEMAFTLYVSVYDTYNLIGHIYKIIAYYLLFKALFVINVHKPYVKLHEAEGQLSGYAEELERTVEERTKEIREATEELDKDLDYARNIQMAMLPEDIPNIPEIIFAARYITCEKIGGDFYDVLMLDDENIGILIGDVAGHGVSAAMVTVFVNQNIYVKREYDDGHIRVLTPKQTLTNLYHIYNKMSFPEEVYTVLFYGIYNLKDMTLTYSSAGMNAVPLILQKDGQVKAIEIEGLPICKLGNHINPNYQNRTIQLNVGDNLIFYTDGLIEVNRKKPELLNEKYLMEYLRGMKGVTAAEIAEYLEDGYYAQLGDDKVLDDVTLLIAHITE